MEDFEREATLIDRARRGDLRAYAALVKQFEERMFYTAYRILHSREDAEDCVQETFLRAWDRIKDLKDVSAFRTWLYRILSNLALDALRGKERQAMAIDTYRIESIRLASGSETRNPREVLRQAREAQRIERAIADLAPKQKIVFVLRHFQGLKISEISEILDAPSGTIKATLHAALAKLRRNLIHRTAAGSKRSVEW
jgi:RNA polymerase sigma-70 factor (ECF subfamily)